MNLLLYTVLSVDADCCVLGVLLDERKDELFEIWRLQKHINIPSRSRNLGLL